MFFLTKKVLTLWLAAMAVACGPASVPAQLPSKKFGAKKKNSNNAPALSEHNSNVNLPAIRDENEALGLASTDITSDKQPADVRYLTLAHLSAAGKSPDELRLVQLAVSKLLNGLSWQPNLVNFQPVDADGLLLKIRLSDFGWTSELWVKLAAGHPSTASNHPSVSELIRATGSDKPILRADYIVRSAARPPLYYQLLQAPNTLAELATRLNLSMQDNINAGKVVRAGFEKSIVSTNHRVIERHQLASGFLWRSYEFGTKTGNRNIFDFPLGPSAPGAGGLGGLGGLLGAGSTSGGGSAPRFPGQAFVSDGGEFYFTLPNGMLAFYIAGATGLRINEVPGADKKKIVAGLSCNSCHSRGTMPARDEVAKKTRVTGEALAEVRRLYATDDVLVDTLTRDRNSYLQTLDKIGIKDDDSDPINAVVNMQQ